jgi:hypothetical protein
LSNNQKSGTLLYAGLFVLSEFCQFDISLTCSKYAAEGANFDVFYIAGQLFIDLLGWKW